MRLRHNTGYKFLYWLPQGAEDVEENRITASSNSNYQVTGGHGAGGVLPALPSEMTLTIDLTEYDGEVTNGLVIDGETVTPVAGQVNTYTQTQSQTISYGKCHPPGHPLRSLHLQHRRPCR
jgi:hypothetical protein